MDVYPNISKFIQIFHWTTYLQQHVPGKNCSMKTARPSFPRANGRNPLERSLEGWNGSEMSEPSLDAENMAGQIVDFCNVHFELTVWCPRPQQIELPNQQFLFASMKEQVMESIQLQISMIFYVRYCLYIYIYGVCLKTGQPWGPRIYWLIKQPIVQHPKCLRNVHCQSLTFQALSGIGSGWVQVTKEKDINGIFRTPK